MAWSITRRATDEDVALLEKRALAFAKRYDIEIWAGDTAVGVVEYVTEWLQQPDGDEFLQMEGKYLEQLWKRIANRAIGDDGIDHGYVGHSVE